MIAPIRWIIHPYTIFGIIVWQEGIFIDSFTFVAISQRRVNEYGLVDIATGASEQGLNFAIGPATIQRVIPELISQGTYEHPWLGIEIADVTPLFADSVGLSDARGVFIKNVASEGPAEKAGITPFSIIFLVDGNVVRDKSELIDYVENNKLPGDDNRSDITSVLEHREEPF